MRPTRILTVVGLAMSLALPALAMKFPGPISGRFTTEIDDSSDAAFREIDGMSATIEVLEYQEGGINDKIHKLVGQTRYGNLVLRKGVSFPDLLLERIGVTPDPNEAQRLQDLLARVNASNEFHLMLTNLDPRELPDDHLFFNQVMGDHFLVEGCDDFVVSAQLPIPGPVEIDVLDPNNLPDSRKLKKLFNAKKDTAGGIAILQKLEPATPVLEFTSGAPMVLEVELFFDAEEDKEDVKKDAIKRVKNLVQLPLKIQKPPEIELIWGDPRFDFKAIIKSVSVKYTLFLPDGTPTRATMSVSFKEFLPPEPPPPGGSNN